MRTLLLALVVGIASLGLTAATPAPARADYWGRGYYRGYYPGYRGCYAWRGTVVFGTGWRYRCWSGRVWYPRPVTWGVGVRYNALSCNWSLRLGGGAADRARTNYPVPSHSTPRSDPHTSCPAWLSTVERGK